MIVINNESRTLNAKKAERTTNTGKQTNTIPQITTATLITFLKIIVKGYDVNGLEALAVYDLWARLVVLLLSDPHLLEGGQGGQNRTTNPH